MTPPSALGQLAPSVIAQLQYGEIQRDTELLLGTRESAPQSSSGQVPIARCRFPLVLVAGPPDSDDSSPSLPLRKLGLDENQTCLSVRELRKRPPPMSSPILKRSQPRYLPS